MLQRGEALPHVVEGARELAQLVRSAVHDRLVEAAARDAVGSALEPPDSAREDAREREADQGGRGERDQAGEQQPALDERDRVERVLDRGGDEQDAVAPRVSDLAEARAVPSDDASLDLPCARPLAGRSGRSTSV